MRRKALDWSYEEEIRVVIPWDACIEDSDIYFCTIEPEDIREVYFGCNAPDTLEADVRAHLSGDLSHVILRKMRVHQDNFSLETEELL